MVASTIWLVIPWAPCHQGGVTGVIKHLYNNWPASSPSRPKVVVNDWSAIQPKMAEDALYFRLNPFIGTSWFTIIMSILRAPFALYRILLLLRSERVAAVNFHYTDHSPIGIALLKWAGLYKGRLLISFHGTDVRILGSRFERWLQNFCLINADALVACSNSLAQRVSETFCIPFIRIKVILNGVDDAVFRPGAPLTPMLEDLLPERYLVSIGTFNSGKAHDDLVQAVSILAGKDRTLHLCIAGADGAIRDRLQGQVDRLGLTKRVHFFVNIGAEDVAAAVALPHRVALGRVAARVRHEGAVGVPIAVSNIPGHDELIIDNITGKLFKVRSPDDCARVIHGMLFDYAASSFMAQVFRERVIKSLTWDVCVKKYMGLYFGLPGID